MHDLYIHTVILIDLASSHASIVPRHQAILAILSTYVMTAIPVYEIVLLLMQL